MPNAGWNFFALGVKILLSDFCSCLPNRTKYLTKSQEGRVDVDLCDWKRAKTNVILFVKTLKITSYDVLSFDIFFPLT